MQLSTGELQRYARHFALDEVGVTGQQKLKNGRILCIGAGGIGCPALLYLTAAGVGTLGVIDPDTIELSNLQRQILYQESDIGAKKVDRAKSKLSGLSSSLTFNAYDDKLSEQNISSLFDEYDIIIDGSDNYPTRYLAAHYSCILNKPLVSASVLRFAGQLSVFNCNNGPCYRCLYPFPPPEGESPNCAQAGVLGFVPGILGVLAAAEASKILLNIESILSGTLAYYDATSAKLTHYRIQKNPSCPLCSNPEKAEPTSFQQVDVGKGRPIKKITAQELFLTIKRNPNISLIDVREPWEHSICSINNSQLIPLSSFNSSQLNFESQTMLIVYCKSGARGEAASRKLREMGFSNVYNLDGGIDAWRKEINPKLQVY